MRRTAMASDRFQSDAELLAALTPYLEGMKEGKLNLPPHLRMALEAAGPPACEWVYRVTRLFHESLQDVTHLDRSAECRAQPDFAEQRERLACQVIGAAFLLERQRELPWLAKVLAEMAESLGGRAEAAEVLAETFIEAEKRLTEEWDA
jgi:hypothetical protein